MTVLMKAVLDRKRGVSVSGPLGRVRLLCGMVVALVVLLLCTGSADAAVGHRFVSSLAEAPPGTGLVNPSVVAVERSTGRVFVGDPLSGYVDVYGASGVYEGRFGSGALAAVGIAVDESSGDVYVADSLQEAVVVYAPDGEGGYRLLSRWFGEATPDKAFGVLSGLAFDNSGGPSAGDLYVLEAKTASAGGGAVEVYRPKPNPPEGEGEEGMFVKRISGGKLEQPNGIAVDQGSGRILIADSVKGAVFAYSPEGVYEEKLSGKGSPYGPFGKEEARGNVAGVAVDGVSGDVYVVEAERGAVSQYTSSGTWQGWITGTSAGDLGEPRGVALDAAGSVYVADVGLAVVDVFGPGVVVPGVETGKAPKSGLTRQGAVLTGTINGEGIPSSYSFQYGQTRALGSQTTSVAAGSGSASVSTEVTGLAAGRVYFYRIAGSNENGVNVGVIRSFETPPAVEELSTGGIKNLQPESVTVTGTLNPGGIDAHYYFQWGATSGYGSTTPVPPGVDAGSGTSVVEAEAVLSGLSPNSTYHYRLVGVNSFGTTYGQDATFTTSGPPRIINGVVTSIGQHEATVNAQIDPDQFLTTYHVEYGETTGYGTEVPVGGESIGSGASFMPVSVVLPGLKVGTTYHYRVVASNHVGVTTGPDQTFKTVPPAPVDATWVTGVSDSEATLHTQINPLGHDTHYYFQYGTQNCGTSPASCTSMPVPPGQDLGAGSEDVAGETTLTELQPDTTYHYRTIATNELGTTEGPERTFLTQSQPGSFALADNRAWEMVTPPDKQGAPVEALTREGGVILTSEEGNTLTYVVDGALGEEVEGNRSPEWQQILATRGPHGWSTQDIVTSNSKAKGVVPGSAPEYQFFDSKLATALVEPLDTEPEPPLAPGVTQATPYLRDTATGTFLPLLTEADTAPGSKYGGNVHFVSATPDLSHVVLTSEVALTGPYSSNGLYEWSEGRLQFVSALPHSGKAAATAELGFFGSVLWHAISNDGSRIFWSSKEENSGRGRLYMRDTVKGETLRLDVAQGVTEPERASAQFQGASADGSRVFFTDKQRLTVDSGAEPAGVQEPGKADLYECVVIEVAGKLSCDLKDLTPDSNKGEHAAVQNFILGANEDGTSLYLVAQGVLAGNQNGNGEEAVNGRDNLYELHYDGSRWFTTFIAMLSEEDGPEWEGNKIANTAYLTARVSPNGRYLAFMSQAPITGYDNVDASREAHGARDEEVYLYDSTTPSLRCVSCNPSGARPAGVLDKKASGEGLGLLVDRHKVWGELEHEHWLAGNIPGWTAQTITSAVFQSRYLSDQGRLYFNSPDSLVPAAKNHKENVYQYEPSGVGSCVSPSGGCLSLISGGSSDRESAFIEATPDGSNVFFVTEAQLLSQDTDTAFDIYDARECTEASPCLTPPEETPAPCAKTETCRPAEAPQQIPEGAAGTETVSGSGNIASAPPPPPPAKGEVEARKSTKRVTRAQKLTNALKRCRKRYRHAKHKRRACKRRAKKRYGPKHATHKRKRSKGKHGARKKGKTANTRGRSGR